jgi:hypothetical protein
VRPAAPSRLRDQRLTVKPRITTTVHGPFFNVERLVPTNHPAARGFPQCKTVNTLAEAIAIAHTWAGPAKPKEKK